jgi:hypothetical protein
LSHRVLFLKDTSLSQSYHCDSFLSRPRYLGHYRFIDWFGAFDEVVKVLSILHLIKYPLGIIEFDYDEKFGIDTPMFGGLQAFEIQLIKRIISEEEFEQIRVIAQNDEIVKKIIEHISKLPDMTENEHDQQIIDFDKEMIHRQGLESWLKNEEFIDRISKNDKKYQKLIRYLMNWAKE